MAFKNMKSRTVFNHCDQFNARGSLDYPFKSEEGAVHGTAVRLYANTAVRLRIVHRNTEGQQGWEGEA